MLKLWSLSWIWVLVRVPKKQEMIGRYKKGRRIYCKRDHTSGAIKGGRLY
jgi:hypothetical protein